MCSPNDSSEARRKFGTDKSYTDNYEWHSDRAVIFCVGMILLTGVNTTDLKFVLQLELARRRTRLTEWSLICSCSRASFAFVLSIVQ
jgi:hypothetical protein